ncbi:snRNA-activating protein complex subunit 1 [Drosophila kikkawai]|uniref:snRNA-activating protein complex subunit 1 n=1 Tax=Drosophila kikkawai TaxID=30033 RepID=A0A6P4JAB7_DROKI|nr:uncharacterized protein LOC108081073 [Drosophila kikkawai]
MELNIYDDCWELVQRFQRLVNDGDNLEFEVFCRCWRELQLQHLFTCQSNHTEVIATTLAALHVAKRLACSRRSCGDTFSASRSQRIAGFYLLYVIYHKQPTHKFVKIDVSPRTWQEMTDYVLLLREESPERKDTQQVAHMFWRLVQEQAFRYTALDYCQGLDNLADYDRLESIVGAKRGKQMVKQQRPKNVSLAYELEAAHELDMTSQSFCDLESAYNNQKQNLPGQQLALPSTNIFGQLQEVFGDIQKLLGGNKNQPAAQAETDQDQSPTSSNKNQLEVRQQVRLKAMYGEEQPQQAVELDCALEVNEAHQRRMSSATVFQRALPEDVQREYELYEFSDNDDDEAVNEMVGEENEVTEEEVQQLLGS